MEQEGKSQGEVKYVTDKELRELEELLVFYYKQMMPVMRMIHKRYQHLLNPASKPTRP